MCNYSWFKFDGGDLSEHDFSDDGNIGKCCFFRRKRYAEFGHSYSDKDETVPFMVLNFCFFSFFFKILILNEV